MSTYVKLFSSLLDSTVWETEPPVKVVWITLLAMADRDGVVEASVPGLAKRAGVSREQCDEALLLFASPDPDSRTKDHEGRRLKEVDGGWLLLNYEKYRDRATVEERLTKAAERQQRYRDRLAASRNASRNANVTPVTRVTPVDARNALSSGSGSKADTEEEKDPESARVSARARTRSKGQEQLFTAPDSASGTQRDTRGHGRSALHVVAARVLAELNLVRNAEVKGARVLAATDENLRYIAERLAAGASEADCLHVVAVRAAEVRAGGDPKWFNACTPFRAASFARAVGMRIEDARPTKTTGGVAKPGKWDDMPDGEM